MDDHDHLPQALTELRADPTRRRRQDHRSRAGRLSVVRGPLEPDHDPATAAILLSGGGSTGPPRLSPRPLTYLRELGLLPLDREPDKSTAQQLLRPVPGHENIWTIRAPKEPLLVVARARLDQLSPAGDRICPISSAAAARRREVPDTRGRLWRDLRLTRVALTSAMQFARDQGRQRMTGALLGAGDLRTTPSSYVLMEMVRAWAEFRQRQDLALPLHVDDLDDMVGLDLAAGRVDVDRLITDVPDAGRRPVEFWIEIAPAPDDADRTLVMEIPDRPLLDVLAEFGFADRAEGWSVSVEPVPCLAWEPWSLAEIRARQRSAGSAPMTLERFGVLHGSTLRLGWSRSGCIVALETPSQALNDVPQFSGVLRTRRGGSPSADSPSRLCDDIEL